MLVSSICYGASLGIDDKDVDIGRVQTELNNDGKGNLLKLCIIAWERIIGYGY